MNKNTIRLRPSINKERSENLTTDPLTQPINYFHITSTSNATSGGVSGGGANCSAGPVTLGVVNG